MVFIHNVPLLVELYVTEAYDLMFSEKVTKNNNEIVSQNITTTKLVTAAYQKENICFRMIDKVKQPSSWLGIGSGLGTVYSQTEFANCPW